MLLTPRGSLPTEFLSSSIVTALLTDHIAWVLVDDVGLLDQNSWGNVGVVGDPDGGGVIRAGMKSLVGFHVDVVPRDDLVKSHRDVTDECIDVASPIAAAW